MARLHHRHRNDRVIHDGEEVALTLRELDAETNEGRAYAEVGYRLNWEDEVSEDSSEGSSRLPTPRSENERQVSTNSEATSSRIVTMRPTADVVNSTATHEPQPLMVDDPARGVHDEDWLRGARTTLIRTTGTSATRNLTFTATSS